MRWKLTSSGQFLRMMISSCLSGTLLAWKTLLVLTARWPIWKYKAIDEQKVTSVSCCHPTCLTKHLTSVVIKTSHLTSTSGLKPKAKAGWADFLDTYSAPEIDEQVNNTDVHVVAANEANHEPEIEDDSGTCLYIYTRKRNRATQGRQQNKKPKCKWFTRVVSYLHVTLNKSYFLW